MPAADTDSVSMLESFRRKAYNTQVSKSARLGQNFLRDKNIARKIVGLLEARPAPLLEIGAGKGILSEMLLERFPGRHITLAEIDPLLVSELERRFAGRVQIVSGDVLQIDPGKLFPRTRITVIGNLPYHISKPLADWFIRQHERINEAVLMLQKDFVDKLLAPSGGKKYNAQSILFQLLFRARRCFDVQAGAFAPQPKIVSTVIAARRLDLPLRGVEEFYEFLKRCFAGRRKTLWNNLAPHYDKEILTALAASSGLSNQARAEQLPAQTFLMLFERIKNSGKSPIDPLS